jgi:hypothetical protein
VYFGCSFKDLDFDPCVSCLPEIQISGSIPFQGIHREVKVNTKKVDTRFVSGWYSRNNLGPAILNEDLHDFPQSLQLSSRMLPSYSQRPLRSTSLRSGECNGVQENVTL